MLRTAPFAYAGFGIKRSDDSGAAERCLTGFCVCSAVGRRMMVLEMPAFRMSTARFPRSETRTGARRMAVASFRSGLLAAVRSDRAHALTRRSPSTRESRNHRTTSGAG
jgi:hypothetical protein